MNQLPHPLGAVTYLPAGDDAYLGRYLPITTLQAPSYTVKIAG